MIRIDYLILGYVEITVDVSRIAEVSQLLLKNKLTAKLSSSGKFTVRASERKRISEILSDIPHTVSKVKGFYGFLLKFKGRYGIIGAMVITLFLCIASSSVVWDVRIDGEGDEAEIIKELDEAGLSPGKLWFLLDKSKIELNVLNKSDNIAWININRRGSVAYVRVVPKIVFDEEPKKEGYANIVASRDCVIEQITVKTGIAMVKPGESVRAGEVLISGVIPTELGGGYCYAEGTVKGRLTDRISVFTSSVVTEKVYSDSKLSSLGIDFFGKHINIFKIYGNSDVNCDIIEKKSEIRLFGKRLPIQFNLSSAKPYVNTERNLSANELTSLSAEKLRLALLERLSESDLLSIRTEGGFTDSGYMMSADVVVCENVSSVKEFQLIAE